jgi:thiamine biosynthesis lipoprotein
MRCASRLSVVLALLATLQWAPSSDFTLAAARLPLPAVRTTGPRTADREPQHATPLVFVHQHRYAMGTVFDVAVYHDSPADAERAVTMALDEIVRLDRVLSNFRPDSALAHLLRGGRTDFVAVEPSLYEVLQQAQAVSRLSDGRFDVTIAPLVGVWKLAAANGRRPSAAEIADARRCVGYDKIQMAEADRIRLLSNCVEIDLGGIGKGFAVDRGIAILSKAGIRHATISAGTSSIAAIGTPPGLQGWPVSLGVETTSRPLSLTLRDASISTSSQSGFDDAGLRGPIVDPRTAAPAESRTTIGVLAPSATVSDALSTTLVMMSREESRTLLARFDGVTAYWISPDGRLESSSHAPR